MLCQTRSVGGDVNSSTRADSRGRRSGRRTTSFFGVLGEVLITVGAVTLLYVAWQMWIGDMISGAQNNAVAAALSQEWEQKASTPAPTVSATPTSTPTPSAVAPIVLPQPADTEVFGIMRIPRFGSDYAVKMAGGVTRSGTLDTIGIGHYPDTAMPGATGNVAFAAHRTTFGAPFSRIADLHIGDAIVIETQDGWYTYRFRTLEYVKPTAVDVLLPVPQGSGLEANGKYLTMTSCSPKFSMTERIVGYSAFESFTPRAAGPPAALTQGVAS
ncbi:MAG: class E sortase [Actinobacteria bacterium]|nr:class E sortase [Actinomycetota bacterium]